MKRFKIHKQIVGDLRYGHIGTSTVPYPTCQVSVRYLVSLFESLTLQESIFPKGLISLEHLEGHDGDGGVRVSSNPTQLQSESGIANHVDGAASPSKPRTFCLC